MELVRMFAIVCVVALSSSVAFAQDTRGIDDGTSLGDVTMDAILSGFDQGAHASDPSGNGVGGGQDPVDNPRVGLPNLAGQGDLSATIDIIDGD